MKKILLFIAFCFLLLSCKPPTRSDIDPNIIKHIEYYGDLPINEIVLYVKKNKEPQSILLFVHGGGWYRDSYQTYITDKMINWSTNNNFIFAAINYSHSPDPIELNNPNRIKHPAHINDLAKSIKWIYNNASKYGINREKIYIIGHSAGSQMACLLGTNQKYLQQVGLDLDNISGVISLDGGAYLTNETKLMFPDDNDKSIHSYYKLLKNLYYNAFTSNPSIYNNACPYLFIEKDKGIAPFLLICQKEEYYRLKPNTDMFNKLKENNISVTLYPSTINSHLQILNQLGTPEDTSGIMQVIDEFLNAH